MRCYSKVCFFLYSFLKKHIHRRPFFKHRVQSKGEKNAELSSTQTVSPLENKLPSSLRRCCITRESRCASVTASHHFVAERFSSPESLCTWTKTLALNGCRGATKMFEPRDEQELDQFSQINLLRSIYPACVEHGEVSFNAFSLFSQKQPQKQKLDSINSTYLLKTFTVSIRIYRWQNFRQNFIIHNWEAKCR